MSKKRSNIRKIYAYKFLLGLHFIGGVLIPFFMDWGGIRFWQVMVLQSFFVFMIFLLEVPTGAVADHLGRKTSLILAALINAAAAFVYASRPDFLVFIAGEFLWAMSHALMSGADEAFVYDSLKEMKEEVRSKEVLARFRSFEMAALMVAAPAGSAIASFFGLRYTMLFMSVPFFLAFLLGFSLEEPGLVERKRSRNYLATLTGGVRYFREHRILKILAFDRISIATLVFFVVWTYQPLLTKLEVPLVYFGLVHAGLTGVQIPFMNNFARLEGAFGSRRRYLFASALTAGLAFILLGISPYVWVSVPLLLLIAGFGMSRAVLFQNYMNKWIESHNRATVISTLSMVEMLILGLLYPLVGFLVEWSLNGTLILIGSVILLCSFLSRVREEHLID